MRNLKIVALSRQRIIYRYPKKEQKREWVAVVASFVLILFCACLLRVQNTKTTGDFFTVFAEVANPNIPLYKEMNEIVFTNTDGELISSVPVMSFKDGKLTWNL